MAVCGLSSQATVTYSEVEHSVVVKKQVFKPPVKKVIEKVKKINFPRRQSPRITSRILPPGRAGSENKMLLTR